MKEPDKAKLSPEIFPKNVLSALMLLREAGYEAYLVGGCVRDLLMSAKPHDWDITTDAEPGETAKVFAAYHVLPTGLKHGTVTVLFEGEPLEITTFRIDGVYSDNRRPDSVEFTRSLRDDLSRRDFTINALAATAQGEIIDYFGGTSDIESGIIRCVGDPVRRFSEDALRILRVFRFASALGFSVDENTADAARSEANRLSNISSERIYSELNKLLCGKHAGEILRKYNQTLTAVLPEIEPMFGFLQHNRHHCFDVWEHTVTVIENTPPDSILRWAALFHDIGKPHTFSVDESGSGHFYGHAKVSCDIAGGIMRRLRFPNDSRDRILMLVEKHDTQIEPAKSSVKRILNKLGREALLQLIILKRADNYGQAPEYRHRQEALDNIENLMLEIIAENECFSLKDLAVTGNDIMSLGYTGSEIGRVLNSLLEAVIEGTLPNERNALLTAAST